MSILADNIKRRRKELGISQEKLAELAGLSPNYIARIETSKRSPSLDILDQLAEALGTNTSALLAEPESPRQSIAERLSIILSNLSDDDAAFLEKEVVEWSHRLSKKSPC
ncbi:MAG: helix-turn-helix domain-containing protein [Armatimonadota bacterium]